MVFVVYTQAATADHFGGRSMDLINTLAHSKSRIVCPTTFIITHLPSDLFAPIAHLRHTPRRQTVRHFLTYLFLPENDLIYLTRETLERVRGIFTGRSSKATWIQLSPLPYSAIAGLVSRTLHRRKEDAAPLARLIHAASGGNAFSARSILTRLQRQNMVRWGFFFAR